METQMTERRKVAIARTSGKFKDAVDSAFSVERRIINPERRLQQLAKATMFRITTPQSKDVNRELKKFATILVRMANRREIYGFDLKLWVEPRTRKTKWNFEA